ncbi:MAG TPA: SDR family NAD(P)-dependent oxidoreductase [Aggregatilineales bacterium]|nr:SDR family oxidoreductase [Anaerolineales bacterium]HRE49214.1 SDR family NAD(P)-dependent oxidoreductase [Aggregatilineales bacterium]
MTTYPDLHGKTAVISGAGGNLGIAVVRRLVAEGAVLALIDMNAAGLEKRLAENNLDPAPMTIIGGVDLGKKADADSAVDQIMAARGRIDVLINIAGGFKADGPVHDMPEAVWDSLITLNLKTAVLLSAAGARAMIAGGRGGRIVNIAARGGLTGIPGIAAYSASKSAVLRLTESMAGELMGHQITVNAVLPSVIDTPQNRAANPDEDYSKWVSPDSLADVIAFLVSAAARDISGASIPVYGRA